MNAIDQIRNVDIKLKPELTGKQVTIVLRDKHEYIKMYVRSDGRALKLMEWNNNHLNLEEMRMTKVNFNGLVDFLEYYFECHNDSNVTKDKLEKVVKRMIYTYGSKTGKLNEAFTIGG